VLRQQAIIRSLRLDRKELGRQVDRTQSSQYEKQLALQDKLADENNQFLIQYKTRTVMPKYDKIGGQDQMTLRSGFGVGIRRNIGNISSADLGNDLNRQICLKWISTEINSTQHP